MGKTPDSGTFQVLDRALLHEPFDGNPGRVVRIVVDLEAAPDEVWRTMTMGEGLAGWVGDVAGEFCQGGHFHVRDVARQTLWQG